MALPDYTSQDSTTYKANIDSTASDHESRIDTIELIGVDASGHINIDRSTAEKNIRFTGPLGSIYFWGRAASTDYDVGMYDGKNARHVWHYDESANTLLLQSNLGGNSFKDEDDMVSDSATAAASQQSIKKYVDDSVVRAGYVLGSSGTMSWTNSGYTSSRTSTGVYVVTHNLGTTNYSVVTNPALNINARSHVSTKGTNSFTVSVANSSNVAIDSNFHWMLQK